MKVGSEGPTKASSVGRNVLWSYGGQAVALLSSVIVAAVAFRRLGAPGFGVYAVVVSITSLLATANFGLNTAVIRATSRDDPAFSSAERSSARREVEVAHAAYAGLAGAALVGTAMILVVISQMRLDTSARHDSLPLMVVLLGISTSISLATSAFTGIPIGRRRFAVNTVSGASGALANLIVVMGLLGTARAGALGAGQLASVVLARSIGFIWLRREEPWFRLVPPIPRSSELKRVMVFAAPLVIIALGGQIIATTDLMVVGAVASAVAVAIYRIGSLAPNQASTVLFTGIDTILPVLAGTPDPRAQERLARFASRIASFSAGVLYGAMILFRADVLVVLSGRPSVLGQQVLLAFAGVWLANVPVHCLALLLIARGRQRSFAPLVTAEILANIGLTILLTTSLGPIGAAVATLVTIWLSNQVLLPWFVRRELLALSARGVVTEGLLFLVIGLIFAGLGGGACLLLRAGLLRLVLGLAGSLTAGSIGGAFLLGPSGRSELVALLRHRGARGADVPSSTLSGDFI